MAEQVSELFISARLLIAAAQEELSKLVLAEKAFIENLQGGVLVKEFEPKTGNQIIKIKITRKVPSHIRVSAYRVVTDLRNALDQSLFAAWTAVTGVEPETNHYFPFGATKSDFEAKVKRQVPETLWETFDRFEAHPTGNDPRTEKDMLSALSKISGPNKHRLVIGVGVNANRMEITSVGGSNFAVHRPYWDRNKSEMELITIFPGGKASYNLFIPIYISFERVKLVDGCSVIQFAHAWITRVSEIVDTIEADATAAIG